MNRGGVVDLDEIMEKIRSFSRPSQVDCEDLFNFLESAYIKNEPSYKWQIKTNDIYFNILNCLNKISNQNQGIYKRNAIFWIGEIGQTEHLESLSFLVLEKSEDIKERVVSIDKILNKPVNITSVRPEHFEMIISRLFERKGFKNVTLTKPLRDKGIDIFMNSNDFKYFVQCKRISFRENLPEGDVKKF
jgi:HJR/Mrr/RecB family endonuclease